MRESQLLEKTTVTSFSSTPFLFHVGFTLPFDIHCAVELLLSLLEFFTVAIPDSAWMTTEWPIDSQGKRGTIDL